MLCTLPDFPVRESGLVGASAMVGAGLTTLLFLRPPTRFFERPAYTFGVAPFVLTLTGGVIDTLHEEPSLLRATRVVAGVFAHLLAARLAVREQPLGTASSSNQKVSAPALERRVRLRIALASTVASVLACGVVVGPHLTDDATAAERTFATVIAATLAISTLLATLPRAMRKGPREGSTARRGWSLLAVAAAVVAAAFWVR